MSPLLRSARACSEGNLDAFSGIYENSVRKIYDFLFFKTLDQSIAEDLTSETYMKALRNIANFSGETERELFAWLYRIAYNTFVDHYRSSRETIDTDEIADTHGVDPDIERSVDDRSKLEEILGYLETIPSDQRSIIIMRIWDDLSYAEIAEITGKSVANCKQIVSRVLRQIQANIAFMWLFVWFLR